MTKYVNNNYECVTELLNNLCEEFGEEDVFNELTRVMTIDDLGAYLEDVAHNWDVQVNEDGTIETE